MQSGRLFYFFNLVDGAGVPVPKKEIFFSPISTNGAFCQNPEFRLTPKAAGIGTLVHEFMSAGGQQLQKALYSGTSLIRNFLLLGPYSKPLPRLLWRS